MTGTIIAKGPGLADLASRINAEHDAAAARFDEGLQHSLVCGQLLIEAKAKVPHGAWVPWLEKNCTVSPRMSQIYMRLARNKAVLSLGSKNETVSHFSLRQAIAAVSRQVVTVAKLPEPIITEALQQEGDPAIEGALKRAEAQQERRKIEEREAERLKRDPPVTRFIQMPTREPTAEEITRDEALVELSSELRKVVQRWMVSNTTISADMICDTINAVYCEVQDGTIRDEAAE